MCFLDDSAKIYLGIFISLDGDTHVHGSAGFDAMLDFSGPRLPISWVFIIWVSFLFPILLPGV
jgi:hypothetical protein